MGGGGRERAGGGLGAEAVNFPGPTPQQLGARRGQVWAGGEWRGDNNLSVIFQGRAASCKPQIPLTSLGDSVTTESGRRGCGGGALTFQMIFLSSLLSAFRVCMPACVRTWVQSHISLLSWVKAPLRTPQDTDPFTLVELYGCPHRTPSKRARGSGGSQGDLKTHREPRSPGPPGKGPLLSFLARRGLLVTLATGHTAPSPQTLSPFCTVLLPHSGVCAQGTAAGSMGWALADGREAWAASQ